MDATQEERLNTLTTKNGVDDTVDTQEHVEQLTPSQIVEEVFMLTRQRIDESDPIVALLIFVDRQLTKHRLLQKEYDKTFFPQLDSRLAELNKTYELMSNYRKMLTAELLAMTKKETIQQVEKHVKTVKDTQNRRDALIMGAVGGLFFLQLLLFIVFIFKG